MSLIDALALPPIRRALLVLLVAGLSFPLAGVFVLRLQLIPLRFALMHSALLGGAIGLALAWNPLWPAIAANLLTVLLIARMGGHERFTTGMATAFFMVISIGLAFGVIYKFNVPAKDAFGILWGNVFALRFGDVLVSILVSLLLVTFVVGMFRPLVALMYDREVAFSLGVRSATLHQLVVLSVAALVAISMRLVGALLLDALLILPALAGMLVARSAKGLFLIASAFGGAGAALGFFVSIWIDIPASSAVTLVIGLAVIPLYLLSQRRVL
jgi:zinc transport system permease protein